MKFNPTLTLFLEYFSTRSSSHEFDIIILLKSQEVIVKKVSSEETKLLNDYIPGLLTSSLTLIAEMQSQTIPEPPPFVKSWM